ncbi:MAG: DUF533 domain-containing protein [Pseudomonadota bacterium]
MPNSADVIGRLLNGVLSSRSAGRVQNAVGPGGLGATDNPLSALFGSLGGGTPTGPSGSGGLAEMATRFLGGMRQNRAAAGGVGAVAGFLLGGGRPSGALQGGALGLLGSLALTALSKSGQQAPPQSIDALPPTMRPVTTDLDRADSESRADLLLNAMIQAAKADGEIDETEIARIRDKLDADGTDATDLQRLLALMQAPLDLDSLVVKINDVETAAEVYAASVLAIDIDTDEERAYLAELAKRTGLDQATVNQLHQLLGVG